MTYYDIEDETDFSWLQDAVDDLQEWDEERFEDSLYLDEPLPIDLYGEDKPEGLMVADRLEDLDDLDLSECPF